MAKKKKKQITEASLKKILSVGMLLLGLILIIESIGGIILLADANQILPTATLVINWLYLSIKTMAGVLFLTYGLSMRKK